MKNEKEKCGREEKNGNKRKKERTKGRRKIYSKEKPNKKKRKE